MPELRLDPISGQWIGYSSERQDRTFLPPADHCPLCPTSAGGAPTEIPRTSFDIVVFDNRFPAFVSPPAAPIIQSTPPFEVSPAAGAAEVVVYSDDHNLPVSAMSAGQIERIIDVWRDRYLVMGSAGEVEYVFIFENKGVETGVTLHHPHGQIYGYPFIPPLPGRELDAARRHLDSAGTCIFCDQVNTEQEQATRVVAENDAFMAFVPFAGRWPYEVHISAKRHIPSLGEFNPGESRALAACLRQVIRGYDALFGFPMPYVMAVHQAPTSAGDWKAISHFHIEFYPPYRTAEKLKYLAGSEIGAGFFLNDVSPEVAGPQLKRAVERGEAAD